MNDELLVHEIFASIQGESSFVGLPCAFVRTTGCDLRCRWCDTPQAFTGGTRVRLAEVQARLLGLGTTLVEVTGGEPLLQPAVLPLMSALCDAGRTVLLETSGAHDIAPVDPRVRKIVDLKAPGSGESARNRLENLGHLRPGDELKFVLLDRDDYDWMRATIAEHRLLDRGLELLVSPVHGVLDGRDLAAWVLADRLPVRLNLPLHKQLWGPLATGV